MASSFADRLEVFFGDASDAMCRVYARLPAAEAVDRLQLAGSLTGPCCLYADTLPATFRFVDRGPGEALVAEALVSEPCFWTPEMPHHYQVEAHLVRRGVTLESTSRIFGIRALGARGRDLIYGGKRWVLRAVCCDEVARTDLAAWRAADAAMVARTPNDALCDEASRKGVLLVAELDTVDPAEIRRLGRWPAVAVVVLPGRPEIDFKGLGHNLLLAQRFEPGEPLVPQRWAQLALCDVGTLVNFESQIAGCRLPVIACRPAADEGQLTAEQGRTLCDRVQRDLAGRVEVAGYIV